MKTRKRFLSFTRYRWIAAVRRSTLRPAWRSSKRPSPISSSPPPDSGAWFRGGVHQVPLPALLAHQSITAGRSGRCFVAEEVFGSGVPACFGSLTPRPRSPARCPGRSGRRAQHSTRDVLERSVFRFGRLQRAPIGIRLGKDRIAHDGRAGLRKLPLASMKTLCSSTGRPLT